MQIGTSQRVGAMPAIIREGILRRRHAMDDPAFRNCVKNGINASAALAALGAVPGRLTLPDPSDPIILTGRVALPANGLWLDGGYSLFNLNAANAGLDFTGIDAGISYCKLQGSQTVLPTAGAAITFTGNQKAFAEKLRMEKVFNGISCSTLSEVILDNIHMRDLHGTDGIKHSGATMNTGVFGARMSQITGDCFYPQANPTSANWKGARVSSTSYSLGDIYTNGNCIYQVVIAGTSDSGGGPNGSHGTVNSRLIVDGTATVQFMCSISLSWILADSFASTISVHGAALMNGAYGVRVIDTVASGSSYPSWITLTEVEVDHSAIAGADVAAGRYFKALGGSWFGSCISGNGVQIGSAYKGGGEISNSEVAGNAQHGILLNQANGMRVLSCDIGSNGTAANNTYNNITVAAGVCGFGIDYCSFLPDIPNVTQPAARPIVIVSGTSDAYQIGGGNLAKGHATANTVGDGGSGSAKSVTQPRVVP